MHADFAFSLYRIYNVYAKPIMLIVIMGFKEGG
jgi:hypothetical protein